MSKVTLRPTSTVANGTSSIGGGAGSRHAALSDDSTSTYVDVTSVFTGPTSFGFTPPAADKITAAIPRARASSLSFASSVGVATSCGGTVSIGATAVVGHPEDLGSDFSFVGAFGDGSVLQVSFWRNGYVGHRLFELYLDVYYLDKPDAAVTGPTGTLTETNRPTITFSATPDPDSEGISLWDVQVFNDAQYLDGGFDPESSTAVATARVPVADVGYTLPIGNPTSWDVDVSLPNDTYRAYYRAYDADVGWSDWAYSEFIVNVTPPDPPAITLAAGGGQVEVAVTPDNSPVATDGILLERSADGGTSWTTVLEDAGGTVRTLYDYLASSGVELTYRASAWNDTVSSRLYSTATEATITPELGWWLKHPTNPALNFRLDDRPRRIRALDEVTGDVRQSELQPVGSDYATVLSDTIGPDKGSITFMVASMLELDELKTLLATLSPILLAGSASDSWRDRWVVFGGRSAQRVVEKVWDSPFDVTLPWTEVQAP